MRSETQEKFKGHPWPSGKQFVILLFLHHQVKVIRCPEMLYLIISIYSNTVMADEGTRNAIKDLYPCFIHILRHLIK